MPEFVEWRKIFRLHRDFEITEKIDGTNGVLYWGSDSDSPYGLAEVDGLVLFAGSRNRWLYKDADNFGFAAWASNNAIRLRGLGPGYHFGEWWGLGIQRGYGLTERRFSLFDWERHSKLQESSSWGIPVTAVPLLGVVNGDNLNESVADALKVLREDGSYASMGFERPEGIVLRHKQSGQRFKVLLEGDETPKGMTMTEVLHV